MHRVCSVHECTLRRTLSISERLIALASRQCMPEAHQYGVASDHWLYSQALNKLFIMKIRSGNYGFLHSQGTSLGA